MNYPKVLIVEEDSLTSEYLELILNYYDINVIGVTGNLKNGMDIFLKGDTDLIICDINLDDEQSSIDFVRTAKKMSPVHVIFLSGSNDDKILKKALRTHPDAYITKPFSHNQLIVSIKRIAAEGGFRKDVPVSEKPTKRELEIIEQLAKGMTSFQIASALNISFETVQTYRKRILSKFRVNSTSEIIVLALKRNWINSNYSGSAFR
ncbi:MAG: response regulator transcription factor [Bacteroidales bacterium]|nr:response regulator transcription factor [Bacteroidales bacterium]